MELSNERIQENKTRFIHILAKAFEDRQLPGTNWQLLLDKLENSNWFTSPATPGTFFAR